MTSTHSPVPHGRSTRKAGTLLIAVPFIAAIVTGYYILGGSLMTAFANRGNARLTTDGWQTAQTDMRAVQPQYGPKFAYYTLQEGQDLAWAAQHFSVSLATLQQLNPGSAVWGTTIMVPPVQQPLAAISVSQLTTAGVTVTQTKNGIMVSNRFVNPKAYLSLPQVMDLTKQYGAITQLGPKKFIINKPLYIQDNIRMDLTTATADTVLLRSSPNFDITTLTFQSSEALIKNVRISTLDPATGKPDTNVKDGRSFLRAYENARMDLIGSTTSYLGMTLDQIKDPSIIARIPFAGQGGVYGVSWRIGTGTFGTDIATGWVENSTFMHNHIGAFTFGASGMMWKSNLFTANEVYGLDPHDDSNNATIEYNRFVANGKHGFIVSKRCDYNIIRNNISVDNALHGFMLHENSDYNVIENNIAIGNRDNFVVYASSYNTVRNNRSYDAAGAHVRINQQSIQNYVTGNTFYNGSKGVYLYDGVNGTYVGNNTFYGIANQLVTHDAARVLYADNQSNQLGYQTNAHDRVVFGVNTINKHPLLDLAPLNVVSQGKVLKQDLTVLTAQALKS
jgi:parallel beta-helix repeat protein